MAHLGCPLTGECNFYRDPAKTPSELFLRQLFCRSAGYVACEISKRLFKGRQVRPGANPTMVSRG